MMWEPEPDRSPSRLPAWQAVVLAGDVIYRPNLLVALIRENSRKFGVSNLQVIHGKAPDAFVDLETPTHAFLGGTGGNMREIIGWLRERNPQIRIVINCIALETLAEITALLQEWEICDVDIASVNIGKAKQLGAYHLMMGQNPIYIVTCRGGGEV